MRLYLVRHAQAHADSPSGGDDDRPLTPHGLAQVMHLGVELASGEPPWLPLPTSLATSPILRARQTAGVLGEALGILPTVSEHLSTHASEHGAVELVERVVGEGRPTLLVGHNPTISTLVSRLCRRAGISLRTGELVAIDVQEHVPARIAAVLRLEPGSS